MIQIQEIDFDSDVHKSYVLKLCKRNKYYIEDCRVQFNKPLLNILRNKTQEHNILKGYLAILNNKVIGFSICDLDDSYNCWDLMFLLIDKKYRGQTYGTSLIKYIINDFENNYNACLMKLKCYDNKVKWYETFGFQNNLRILKDNYNYLILFNTKKESTSRLKELFDYTNNMKNTNIEKKQIIDMIMKLQVLNSSP